jgi:hypothetical protein
VEEWNINLLVNIVGLESYYNSSKRLSFEDIIAPHVTAIHECLLRLRFPEVYASRPDKGCVPTGLGPLVAASPEVVNQHLDLLETQLYCFTTGLSKTSQPCPLVIGEEHGVVDLGPPEPAKPETANPKTEKPN